MFSFAIIALLITSTHVATARLISDRGSCLNDADCPFYQFCNDCRSFQFCIDRPYTCLPKQSTGAICGRDTTCKFGNFCGPRSRFAATSYCQAFAPLNATCETWRGNQCGPEGAGVRCIASSRKCRPRPFGLAGSRCNRKDDCDESKGLFCNYANRKCESQRNAGVACNNGVRGNMCKGYCDGRVCQAVKEIGAICGDSKQCRADPSSIGKRNEVICNLGGTKKTGRCIRQKDVLKRAGARCSPNNDICDRRRQLVCKWHRPSKRFACQQNGSIKQVSDFCTPNSPFSVCIPNGFPLTCRVLAERERPGIARFNPSDPVFNFKTCAVRIEVAKRGQICELVNAICPKHLSCEVIDGMEPARNDGITAPAEEFTKFCVKIRKKVGGECGNKFLSKCGPGLKCVNGKCAMGTARNQRVAHLSFNAPCSNNTPPCAPGLVCNRNDKLCKFPFKVINEGGPCYTSSFFKPVSSSSAHFLFLVNHSIIN